MTAHDTRRLPVSPRARYWFFEIYTATPAKTDHDDKAMVFSLRARYWGSGREGLVHRITSSAGGVSMAQGAREPPGSISP